MAREPTSEEGRPVTGGIVVRGERPGDEEAVDLVNFMAFDSPQRGIGGGQAEVDLVRRLRLRYPGFDRRFSVTAWAGGEMVGHALFTPALLRLLRRDVRALAVGPVAIVPRWQRRGVGGELLRHGHELGRSEGYELAFLLGHPGYYPRHGYIPCFGFARATIDLALLPASTKHFEQLPVQSSDLPWLADLCRREHEAVDFGWLWGTAYGEWAMPGVQALVWRTDDGRRAAYTLRVGTEWKHVLAEDVSLAREVICAIRPASLAHHRSGWLARHALDPAWSTCGVEASEAAMACELSPGALEPYLEEVNAATRLPGACNFALPYLLC